MPVYGKLSFRDRAGQPAEKGINVGDEWTYRSYIEGGTLAAAVWTFHGITEDEFPNGLPVEMTIGVFRTHKGDIEKGVLGSLAVRNPKDKDNLPVRSASSNPISISPTCRSFHANWRRRKGRSSICSATWSTREKWRCGCGAWTGSSTSAPPRPICTSCAPDAYFLLNFAKGYFGIWLQMVSCPPLFFIVDAGTGPGEIGMLEEVVEAAGVVEELAGVIRPSTRG